MNRLKTRLRVEASQNSSGVIFKENRIQEIREKDYYVLEFELDGDAPKQFIKTYEYTKGSRVRRANLESWVPYIAKTAEKWYPHESIIEYMINRVGQVLGLNMNEVRLARVNGQIRFLSKYFRGSDEMLIHGAEICGDYLADPELAAEIANSKSSARELFTFEFIRNALKSVFKSDYVLIISELVRMMAFDAVVGNNDRHFYNWGVLYPKRRGTKTPKFAPVYDSARGLFWNWDTEKIVNTYNLFRKEAGNCKKIINYINGAKPRVSIEGDSEINHFDFVAFLKKNGYASIIDDIVSLKKEEEVNKMLRNEFFPFFSYERQNLTLEVLKIRFKRIREI